MNIWMTRLTFRRTVNIIWLVDCSFSFFFNFPARFELAEMQCDLVSKDSFFDSPHPFAEPGFRFSREQTLLGAVQTLLNPAARSDTPNDAAYPYMPAELGASDPRIFDTFITIHGKIIPCQSMNLTDVDQDFT